MRAFGATTFLGYDRTVGESRGVALVADGFKFHIPRGYIYFAIAFSAAVEFFNVLAKRNRKRTRN